MKVCSGCGDCFDDGFDFCASCGGGLEAAIAGPRLLSGRYRLEKKLAEGAMGMVFQAEHLAVGSRVAIKVMQPQQKELQVAVQRFHKEARILGAVKHPHAVLITDFDVDDRGGVPVAYLVTELLRGRSLADWLEQKGALTIDEVERIVTPLADAVEEAHAQGIIHRDLKPSNVFLERLRDGSDVVKVLDFGIAKLLSASTSPATPSTTTSSTAAASAVPSPILFNEPTTPMRLPTHQLRDEILSAISDDDSDDDNVADVATRADRMSLGKAGTGPARPPTQAGTSTWAGMMVGTVPYMAPEQMTGEHVTRRSDVYALAVMVYEMLSGRWPFEGTDEEIIQAKLACIDPAERPSLRDVGVDVDALGLAALDDALVRAFSYEPDDRPAAVKDLAAAISAAAKQKRGDVVVDAIDALALKLSATARALATVGAGADAGGARDVLLAASVSLDRAKELLPAATKQLAAPPQARLVAAHLELDDQVAALKDVVAARAAVDVDGGPYLSLLWRRIDAFCTSVGELLDPAANANDDVDDGDGALSFVLAALDPQQPGRRRTRSLEASVQLLHAKDSLDASDALEHLLDESAADVARLIASEDLRATRANGEAFSPRELREALLAGLWRHAESVLLHDVGAERAALRFVPLLAHNETTGDDDPRFSGVIAALRDRRGAVVVDDVLAAAAADGAGALSADARPALRCLLLHPVPETRAAALRVLPLADLWTVAAHPRTPLAVIRQLFAHVVDHGHADHAKVFFFCVHATVLGASTAELKEALAFVRRCFDVPCFHEDVVFEPLLELERTLRKRADAAGLLDNSYVNAVATFVDGGARDDAPLDHISDVPLPIQRKLARDGRFLSTFVCHGNERVALETLPHLLRLDDITRFLRMVQIHRSVLVELAKRRRLFKKDPPRVALLQNPKTPAGIARPFIALMSEEQLRVLAHNRAMNPDVRRLIQQALGD